MKCMKCGNKEATVFISQNINGNVTKKYLCEDCANTPEVYADIGKFDKMMSNVFNRSSRFFGNDFFSLKNPFENFFEDEDSMLSGIKELGLPDIEEKDNNDRKRYRIIKKEKKIDTKKNELEKLQEELNKAIAEEKYEDAAKLRDKIKEFKKGE